MPPTARKLLVVQAAALGHRFLTDHGRRTLAGMTFGPIETVFPAVTCTFQAAFRTAAPPSQTGVAANGFYSRELHRAFFWEQSADLVSGPRIWERRQRDGARVAMLFWQQSLGESADILLSPAPIHKHHGGMIQDCYCQPADLYARLCRTLGRPFQLRDYWGPMARPRASDWIADATAHIMRDPTLCPDICFTYLPALDYDLQRFGPDSPQAATALDALERQIERLLIAAHETGYEVVVCGDYAIAPCPHGAVFPNQALADAGLLAIRRVAGLEYVDLHASRAFALADHEVALVYVRNPAADADAAAAALAALDGIETVMSADARKTAGVDHPRTGELLAVAADGYWMAYPWWRDNRHAPDYARHVDIHNKPGYDPCELFWGWPPGSVSLDTNKIRGSHGRVGPGREAAFASTSDAFAPQPATVPSLAKMLC